MKPIICMGFIFPDLACSLSLDSARGNEGDGGLAASDRIGHWRGGFGSVARDCALANGTGACRVRGAGATHRRLYDKLTFSSTSVVAFLPVPVLASPMVGTRRDSSL